MISEPLVNKKSTFNLKAKLIFLDFLEFRAFQAGKKLYHMSYLPKGYTWTKIEKN